MGGGKEHPWLKENHAAAKMWKRGDCVVDSNKGQKTVSGGGRRGGADKPQGSCPTKGNWSRGGARRSHHLKKGNGGSSEEPSKHGNWITCVGRIPPDWGSLMYAGEVRKGGKGGFRRLAMRASQLKKTESWNMPARRRWEGWQKKSPSDLKAAHKESDVRFLGEETWASSMAALLVLGVGGPIRTAMRGIRGGTSAVAVNVRLQKIKGTERDE